MSILIAVATKDGKTVSGHFGHTKQYRIYSADPGQRTWEEKKTVSLNEEEIADIAESSKGTEEAGCLCMGRNEKIIDYIADQLQGTSYVLLEKIGPKPQKVLLRHGIEALEVTGEIAVRIDQLLQYLNNSV